MPNFDYDIGIVGGGSAGLTIASGAAQLGAKTLLIEKETALGGDCLHYGCVPSKTLIKTAHVYHMMKKAKAYGLPDIEVPPVDFNTVRERIKSVIGIIQKHDSAERFCKLGALTEFGTPVFEDLHAVKLNGRIVSAKQWVVATGSSPSLPPIPGLKETPHVTNREIFYLDKLPKSLIILGGGPIGIEMAQAFCRLGSKVTVINRGDQILGKEDKDMADMAMEVMTNEGVDFRMVTSVNFVRDLGAEKEVEIGMADGENISIKAEMILAALGRKANTDELGLENIGVEFNSAGVAVDNRLRTSQKHIYAAGDVNGGYQFTHAAGYEGGIVISNAIFHLPRKTDYTWLPWCTYTDPELASIGMNEKRAADAGIKFSVWTEKFRENDRSLAEGEKTGIIKMILDEKEKPLGVQILGPQAGELIGEWVAALNGKVKLSTIASAVHPYPTLGEINKRVVGSFFSPKIFSKKIKKGLALFFNLKGRACGE
ncbi:MAG: FAD-dependent oxidoreductase [Desulfobacterales bacterium]|nr:FAD-dependent oxidoreductase [Desulfobacterales bacterium]